SATAPWPGGRWLAPDPSPSPWSVTTPGKRGAPRGRALAEPHAPWVRAMTGPLSARFHPGLGGCPALGCGGALPCPREPVTPLEDARRCRTGSVSSGAVQPTWVPFGSTVAHRRRLRFALDVYDSTWSSRLRQPTYSLGELINIEVSVGADPRLPLRVFVDQCVASPGAAPWLKYDVIADNG
ncbi:ZP3 protein, partial [Cochlearius cochlearius]|nr:ZP3 protein [Cochlearius cochlearius]